LSSRINTKCRLYSLPDILLDDDDDDDESALCVLQSKTEPRELPGGKLKYSRGPTAVFARYLELP